MLPTCVLTCVLTCVQVDRPELHTECRVGTKHAIEAYDAEQACNPRSQRLQPCVLEAATLCAGGCNPM